MYPENFHYTKEHEWVRVEGDIGAIGITDHAQKELGDIVYVDLPKLGTHRRKGQDLRIGGIGQSRLRYLRAGLRRSRSKSTTLLATAPEKLNEDPHGEAWLVKIKLSAPDEIKDLLSADDYQNYVGAEESGH